VATSDPIEPLRSWIAAHRRVFVLTGAGCSTASGIPDYRDENGEWKRRPPVMFQAFRTDEAVYRRYWARACAGWPRFLAAAPGAAHEALAAWEHAGTLACLVTQNVDGLHQRAGSRAVIDLHGRLDAVVCLDCGDRTPREDVQKTMAADNPAWSAVAVTAPDGDADIDAALVESFVAPR
jgi:NAD-dependent SIR2 family protein deacetylase